MLVGILLLGDCVLIQNRCHIHLYGRYLWGVGVIGIPGVHYILKIRA